MLEIIRYALAAIVAETHLWPLGVNWAGSQAVFAFYALSGYLMTRILHERYGFTPRGITAFLINRVLRLWPAYLVVIAGTALALRFLPLQNFFFSLVPPRSLLGQVTNLTILGQVGFDFTYLIPLPRLAPTSWSLSIELFCYCLLGFYFGKTPRRLIALAAVGAAGTLLSTGHCWLDPSPYYGTYCFQNRYGVLQAGVIPFATGGLVYFYDAVLRRLPADVWPWLVAGLIGCELLVGLNEFASVTIGPFLGVVAMTAILVARPPVSRPSPLVDFIGRASYHLFIAHMSIGAILVVGLGLAVNTLPVFALSLPIAFLLSSALVPLEWRVNRVRGRISSQSRLRVLHSTISPAVPILPAGPTASDD
jgi:peptidoglycan/LPS O-acetylase OafA/YrhL